MCKPSAEEITVFNEEDTLAKRREEFNSYDDVFWERTLFDEDSGGYVVTERKRIPSVNANNNIKMVFNKERTMCIDLAEYGFCLKHLYEAPGKSSADIEIYRGLHSIVIIDGKKADLIVFKFKEHDPKIPHEIRKLQVKGWHGIYYYSGGTAIIDF